MRAHQSGQGNRATRCSSTNPVRKHLRRFAWLLLAVSAATGLSQSTNAGVSPGEGGLFRMTNAVRSEQRLALLQWDDSLARAAQAHAELLAQNGRLAHEFPGEATLALRVAQAGVHFQTVAENIAEGPDIDAIQKGWMNSPPHRANILDARLNAVGFAVIQRGDLLYAVADFAHTVPSLSVDQVEAAIQKLLSAQGVPASGSRLDARETCEMSHGTAGGSSPRFVMRWQSSDLSGLPASLEEKLRTQDYHNAAVGACASANAESGFTTYRVAVLLY
jgi:uncharacterized protein YkwD